MTVHPPYIYLVEDDANDRHLLKQAFADVNFEQRVSLFPSSVSFINHISAISETDQKPTLIVLDFNMPIINGGELLIKIKQLPALQSIPVVLYATGILPILRETLMASGALDCFKKGVSYHEIYNLAKTLRMIAEGHEVVY